MGWLFLTLRVMCFQPCLGSKGHQLLMVASASLPTPGPRVLAKTHSLEFNGGGWSEFCQSVWSKFRWLHVPFREIIKVRAKAYESIFVSLILFIMHFINIFRRDCALI